MTRQEYIDKVKVKLDEVSPFDEPLTFIAASGDSSFDKVKPITKYIEEELPNAVRYCLNALPLSLLSLDIKKGVVPLSIANGIGVVPFRGGHRLCRVQASEWERDVTAFYTSEDVEYLTQQNKHTRSGVAKPSVFFIPEREELELYSFPINSQTNSVTIWSIDTLTRTENVLSEISDFIVLKCAQLVLDILGSNSAQMEKEFERKVNAL